MRRSISPGTCPCCGERGKPVQGQTVKSLLAISLRTVRDVQYHFCRRRDCPVVYFSDDGQQQFVTSDIRELVYQKEPDTDQVQVCYCFGYRAGALRAASAAERDSIIADINAGIQASQCACDLRNPQGSCCLGNVRAFGRQRTAALAVNSEA
ncbi:MAG: hypothetical protein IT318_26260 [Anaerolineales bacterium]|nr:hypothetical protein [Anaerolineales bacterium]